MDGIINRPQECTGNPELSQDGLIAALSLCMQDILTNENGLYEISIIMQGMPSEKEAKDKWLSEQLLFLSKFFRESCGKITGFSQRTGTIFLNCTPEILDQIIHTGKVKGFSPRNLNDQRTLN